MLILALCADTLFILFLSVRCVNACGRMEFFVKLSREVIFPFGSFQIEAKRAAMITCKELIPVSNRLLKGNVYLMGRVRLKE